MSHAGTCNLFVIFCVALKLDLFLYHINEIQQLISLFDNFKVVVYIMAWKVFDIFIKAGYSTMLCYSHVLMRYKNFMPS